MNQINQFLNVKLWIQNVKGANMDSQARCSKCADGVAVGTLTVWPLDSALKPFSIIFIFGSASWRILRLALTVWTPTLNCKSTRHQKKTSIITERTKTNSGMCWRASAIFQKHVLTNPAIRINKVYDKSPFYKRHKKYC